jgi:hypothetical protein
MAGSENASTNPHAQITQLFALRAMALIKGFGKLWEGSGDAIALSFGLARMIRKVAKSRIPRSIAIPKIRLRTPQAICPSSRSAILRGTVKWASGPLFPKRNSEIWKF